MRHLCILFWFSSLLFCSAEIKVLVQDPGGYPKESAEIKIGQRFRMSKDGEFQFGHHRIKFSIGSIGLRINESEIFLAKGQIHIHKKESDSKSKAKPLTVRYPWGVMHSQGGDHLMVNLDNAVRWHRESQSPDTHFQYKRKKVDLLDGQLFIAHLGQVHIIEAKKGRFDLHQVYYSSKQELLLSSRLVGTSHSSTSGRNQSKQNFIQDQTLRRERNHARTQARRNFNF